MKVATSFFISNSDFSIRSIAFLDRNQPGRTRFPPQKGAWTNCRIHLGATRRRPERSTSPFLGYRQPRELSYRSPKERSSTGEGIVFSHRVKKRVFIWNFPTFWAKHLSQTEFCVRSAETNAPLTCQLTRRAGVLESAQIGLLFDATTGQEPVDPSEGGNHALFPNFE